MPNPIVGGNVPSQGDVAKKAREAAQAAVQAREAAEAAKPEAQAPARSIPGEQSDVRGELDLEAVIAQPDPVGSDFPDLVAQGEQQKKADHISELQGRHARLTRLLQDDQSPEADELRRQINEEANRAEVALKQVEPPDYATARDALNRLRELDEQAYALHERRRQA